MKPLLIKQIEMPYYDTDTFQFQLKENGELVSETLADQTIKFFVRNGDNSFTDIEKDVIAEGWLVSEGTKTFKVVIDTEAYDMTPSSQYIGRIEWVDRKIVLVGFSITVTEVDLWSVE